MGIAHSPCPSSPSFLPGTDVGSMSKARQNEALAAMIFRSSDRKSRGSWDETTTARVLAASKCTVGVVDMKWPSGAEDSRSESLLGGTADKPRGAGSTRLEDLSTRDG